MLPGRGRHNDGPTYPQVWCCVLVDQVAETLKPAAGSAWKDTREMHRRQDAYEMGRVMTRGRERSGF
jgi:hypothetical protein